MAFTQADLDALDEMIASGLLESETADGKRVKFATFTDLKQRRAFVARALRGRRKTSVGLYSPGDGCE